MLYKPNGRLCYKRTKVKSITDPQFEGSIPNQNRQLSPKPPEANSSQIRVAHMYRTLPSVP